MVKRRCCLGGPMRFLILLFAMALSACASAPPDRAPGESGDEVVVLAGERRMSLFVLRDNRRNGYRREAVISNDWLHCHRGNGRVFDGRVFLVPQGYMTDFASIPPIARSFVSQFGSHAEASVIHDWLYAVGYPEGSSKEAIKQKRKDADDIMDAAMREQEVPWLQRSFIFLAVRMFGGGPFGKDGEWKDNWASAQAHFVERGEPPFDKPQVSHVVKVSDCEQVEENEMIAELIRFQYGTLPDPCTTMRQNLLDYGLHEAAPEAYLACLMKGPTPLALFAVLPPDRTACTNRANYACAELDKVQADLAELIVKQEGVAALEEVERVRGIYRREGFSAIVDLILEAPEAD
jgi:hypothetical protein